MEPKASKLHIRAMKDLLKETEHEAEIALARGSTEECTLLLENIDVYRAWLKVNA